ncbi:MAG: hypothetical protein ACOX4A_10020 [Saccharofermentanales bacterium]
MFFLRRNSPPRWSEFADWCGKSGNTPPDEEPDFCVEEKIDGLSVLLTYENGRFRHGCYPR